MVPARPVAAFVLGLIGGIFILLGGLVILIGAPFPLGIFAVLGIVFGILVIVGSVVMFAQPNQHVVWGVIILVFSATSIIVFGGFIVGLVLGVLGGILGIAWRPEGYLGGPVPTPQSFAGPYGVPVMPWRMCMGCGRWIAWTFNVCPLCGTAAPRAPWIPQAWAGDMSRAAPPAPPPGAPPPSFPSPAPQAPPRATEKPLTAPCPTCEREAEWLPTYKRWYCRAEARYF